MKVRKKNVEIFLWVLKIFIVWRLSLFIFAWIGVKVLPFKYSFPYQKELLEPFGSPIFWSWANFDGVHYLGIAQKGYFAQYTQAFFPLYPLLIRWFNNIFSNYLLTGLFISNLCFLGSIYFFYKLMLLDYSENLVRKAILLLIFSPTSFFFGSLYSESLFLFELIICFYFIRKKKWIAAGLFAFAASLTRVIGVVLVPALLVELYKEYKKNKNKNLFAYLNLFIIFMPLIGLFGYMKYLKDNFSDALYFLHAQPAFGASRSGGKIILLYQVFYRYAKMLLTLNNNLIFNYTLICELISGLGFLVLLVLGFIMRVRLSYLIFATLAYILPTLTGTFSSMPRYILVLFPTFIVLAELISKKFFKILILIFFLFLGLSTILFTRGYWIG